MKLLPIPSLFKPKDWPLCTQQPKTSSFRIMALKDDIYKTINSMYLDHEGDSVETPDSWFTHSSKSLECSMSTSCEYDDSSVSITGESHLEEIVRGASSNHRLFFDPDESQSPKIQTSEDIDGLGRAECEGDTHGPYEKSIVLSLESEDPYGDFKESMEEMVESLGVRDDWEGLEDLLRWYLKVNGRETHGYIINAFVDLLGGVIRRKSISVNNNNDNSNNNNNVNNNSISNCLDYGEISKSSSINTSTSFSSALSFLSSTASS